jgi:uncharacterized protein (TIGR02246 family)
MLALTLAMAVASPLAATSASARDGCSAAATTQTRGVVQWFVRAWNQHDTAALLSLFAPHGVLTTPSGYRASGRGELRDLLERKQRDIYHGTTLRVSAVHVTCNERQRQRRASGSYTLHGVELAFGIDISVSGTFVMRLVPVDGNWRIQRAHIAR